MLKIISIPVYLILSALVYQSFGIGTSKPCQFELIGDGICVCSNSYCDTLEIPVVKQTGNGVGYSLTTSSQEGKRFDTTFGVFQTITTNRKNVSHGSSTLKLSHGTKYQKMIGFGGALTDSSSELVDQMNETLRNYFYESIYSPTKGAGQTITRVPVGGTDFSDQPWGYNETPVDDKQLTNMTILDSRDERRIRQIKEARQIVPELEETMRYMFCAWSAIPWMKNNNAWTGPLNTILPTYYPTWALYLVKVLNLWLDAGVKAWGLSTGNEPTNTIYSAIPTTGWDPYDQIYWVNEYLRPTMNKNNLDDVKILGIDDQRSVAIGLANGYQNSFHNTSIPNIDIFALHFYYDNFTSIKTLDALMELYDKPMLLTEGSLGVGGIPNDPISGPMMGSWSRAEYFVTDFIENFQHNVAGYCDWNYVLNEVGGPASGSHLDAPMIFIAENQTLIKQPAFYAIAHFSKFLRPNCTRIKSTWNNSNKNNVKAISFACANDDTVIILYNQGSEAQNITVIDSKNNNEAEITVDAKSINTLTYKLN